MDLETGTHGDSGFELGLQNKNMNEENQEKHRINKGVEETPLAEARVYKITIWDRKIP